MQKRTAAGALLGSAGFDFVSTVFEASVDTAAVADDLALTFESTRCRMRDSSTSSTTSEFSKAIQ
jgi:hypothetical protein